jgi:hypothetical protein
MAITHNLSSASNNLSGFDPVAGEVDGTTFGRNWLLWKVFDAWRTFDTRITLITASSPTPTFLQAEVGTILSVPAKNASSTNQTIRFYMNDDPGLAEATPNAMVFEMHTGPDISSSVALFNFQLRFVKSGSATTTTSGDIFGIRDAGITIYNNNSPLALGYSTSTTTTTGLIPKVIFYKSGNLFGLFGIRKDTAVIAGGGFFVKPTWSGYINTSGSLDEGVNLNAITWFLNSVGQACYEGFSNTALGSYNAINAQNNMILLGGLMPSSTFTVSGVVYLISGVVRVAINNNTNFKAVTNELEGLIYAHSSALTAGTGTISVYNNKYYLNLGSHSDGTWSPRLALELQSV